MGVGTSIDAAAAAPAATAVFESLKPGVERAVGAALNAAEMELLKRRVVPTLPNILNMLAAELQRYAAVATTASGTDVMQATPSEVLAPLRSKAEKTLNPLRETC